MIELSFGSEEVCKAVRDYKPGSVFVSWRSFASLRCISSFRVTSIKVNIQRKDAKDRKDAKIKLTLIAAVQESKRSQGCSCGAI